MRQPAGIAVGIGTGLLGLVGFVVSFARVSAAAAPSFGVLAPLVPVGIDLGIAVFSAAGVYLAWQAMPAAWVRLVPAGLTAATVYLNISGERSPVGVVAHAVLPALWVLAVATAEHVVRHRLSLRPDDRIESIRLSRWVLAPLPTVRLWRRMILWEIRSYPAALDRERDRILALGDLADTYGPVAWRWRAPRRERALFRLGELAPRRTAPQRPPQSLGELKAALSDAAPVTAGPMPADRAAPRGRTLAALRTELSDAIAGGRVPADATADAIRRELRCGPDRARVLRDELRAAIGSDRVRDIGSVRRDRM